MPGGTVEEKQMLTPVFKTLIDDQYKRLYQKVFYFLLEKGVVNHAKKLDENICYIESHSFAPRGRSRGAFLHRSVFLHRKISEKCQDVFGMWEFPLKIIPFL